MPAVHVDSLTFDFPDGWHASKYDDWSFYRRRFTNMCGGAKAVDVIALDPSRATAWFIEAKDFRNHPFDNPVDLCELVVEKVFDTLAGLLPAALGSSDSHESGFAQDVLNVKKLRVVLHLEQPRTHDKSRPVAISPADALQKLKQLVRPVDAHPLVASIASPASVPWTVR
ncbi:MAG: hypothetical protein IPM79_14790 [Polyangiaceae bacterium]|jgi:hypothetical protein|nr:hypothetical protein [Polyangiaceae bacterium]MBK8938850.1 hypothetical protein [Polyangiaceae bacterium]